MLCHASAARSSHRAMFPSRHVPVAPCCCSAIPLSRHAAVAPCTRHAMHPLRHEPVAPCSCCAMLPLRLAPIAQCSCRAMLPVRLASVAACSHCGMPQLRHAPGLPPRDWPSPTSYPFSVNHGLHLLFQPHSVKACKRILKPANCPVPVQTTSASQYISTLA